MGRKSLEKKKKVGKAVTDRPKDRLKSSRAVLKQAVSKNVKGSARKVAKGGSPQAGSSKGGKKYPCDNAVVCPACNTTISRYVSTYSQL